jgi:hypothetical protein
MNLFLKKKRISQFYAMVEITKDVLILFMQFNNDIKSAFGQ